MRNGSLNHQIPINDQQIIPMINISTNNQSLSTSIINQSLQSNLSLINQPTYIAFSSVYDVYVYPSICVLGTIGNIIAILVFLFTYQRFLPSSVYLLALTVSDTAYLIMMLMMSPAKETHWLHFYFLSVSSTVAPWFTTAFTVERYIVTLHPIRGRTYVTVCHARIVCTIIVIVAGVLQTDKLICGYYAVFNGYSELIPLNIFQLFLIRIIPSCLICLFNTLIIIHIRRHVNLTRTMSIRLKPVTPRRTRSLREISNVPVVRNNSLPVRFTSIRKFERRQNGSFRVQQMDRNGRSSFKKDSTKNRVTKMLITISSLFLLLSFPLTLLWGYDLLYKVRVNPEWSVEPW